MAKRRKIIALIPARSGSKGIINKNMYLINSQPLINFTILSALDSNLIDEIFVSSDSQEILDHAKTFGVKSHLRSSEYAQDNSPAHDVVREFIKIQSLSNMDILIYLQPSSPLRNSDDIDKCIQLMQKHNFYRIISICKNNTSPFKSFILDESSRIKTLFKEKYSNYRRQDLPMTYTANGALYGFSVEEFNKNNRMFPSNNALSYEMPQERSIDIDTIDDIKKVEFIMGDRVNIHD